ncbi:proteasome-activating nucleotidase [Decorospora gaudefroyi]|uniref:Proteasome-activating nucleotidase n=1 Tax=Decorospora gaudefroyi TaxID=184978 RepID=A0A6A5KDE5_9PLEO|nr:proteasome-activating nucleotidase [Decorospora gaudefroyi]
MGRLKGVPTYIELRFVRFEGLTQLNLLHFSSIPCTILAHRLPYKKNITWPSYLIFTMPASRTLLSATQSNSAEIFHAFKSHCDAPRVDTKTSALTLIRSAYPDYHVTEVEEKYASLFEFAGAGKAVLSLDAEEDEFYLSREWKAVGEGVRKKMHPGELTDRFRFARFQYIWEDHEYIVYYITWQDMLKNPDKFFYVLSPRAPSSTTLADSHSAETDALLLTVGKWTSQLHEEIFVFDDGYWEKSKELWRSVRGSSWSDVILDTRMKASLIADVQGFFDNRALYESFAVPWKRGVILHGVPGNGKTASIKALMNALYERGDGGADSIPSLYVKSFETDCNTEQHNIREIFQQARAHAPCLLIFEDLDSLVNDNIRSYFLNEVDGLESNDGILMIGSTNHLDKLDPAIAKRPSRFDRKYHFKIPGEHERRLYAEYWRAKLEGNGMVEFPEEVCEVVAQMTDGFSFAYLKELFVMALLTLVRGINEDEFEIEDEEVADGAEKEKEKDAGATEKENKEEQDLCTCATKCPRCDKPLPPTSSSGSSKKADVATEAEEETSKNKHVLPQITIPDHLQANLLLKVIKQQIRILHAEMDNTKEESWPSGKKGVQGEAKSLKAHMAAMRRRAAAMRRAC